jgi:integrase
MARRARIIKRRPGSPFWYCNFTVDGRRFRDSLGTHDEAEAERLAAEIRAKALAGERVERRRTMTLDEACGAYWLEVAHAQSSADSTKHLSRQILAGLGKATRLDRIDPRDVAAYVAQRRAQVAPASVNRELEFLRRVLRRADTVWKVPVAMPPWRDILLEEPDEPERILSAAEEKRLFKHLRPDFRAMVRFALITGQRLGNVIGLSWDQVDWEEQILRLRAKSRKPGGKVHIVPLTRTALAILSAEKGRHPDRVFTYVNERGRWDRYAGRRFAKGDRRPFTKNGWRKEWMAALEAAEIRDFRFHDLRHTAGTRTLAASGNLKVVQRLLGHQQIATTTRYLRAQVDDVRAALDAVEAQWKAPAPKRRRQATAK